jgi:hypothetical protein
MAIFPHFPEDIVARPGCSKTWVTFTEDFLDQGLSSVLVRRQGSLIPHLKREGKTYNINRGFSFYLGIPRWAAPLCRTGHPSLPCSPTLPPVAKVLGKTFRYIQLQPPEWPLINFFCLFVLFCLFALWSRYLVFLYHLKTCTLKNSSINEGL